MAINFAQGNSSYLLGYVPKWTFSVVPGVFHEFTTEDLPDGKLPTQPRLGLLHREYPSDTASAAVPNGGATTNGAANGANGTSNGTSNSTASKHETNYTQDWPRFAEHVRTLNREAPEGVAYKVLYLTRHGVGYHNQKSVEVGVEAWDNHWALLNGDGVNYWFDSYLAPEGESQARALSTFNAALFTRDGAPLPSTVYTSPLSRCLQTTDLAYRPVLPGPFRAIVKETLRERWNGHTCDRRRTRTHIDTHWGGRGYVFEDGFEEGDPLRWEEHEDDADHVRRKQKALDDIWDGDEGLFILLVCHSFAIRTIQMLVGSAVFRVKEGSSMALLIKGEKI